MSEKEKGTFRTKNLLWYMPERWSSLHLPLKTKQVLRIQFHIRLMMMARDEINLRLLGFTDICLNELCKLRFGSG